MNRLTPRPFITIAPARRSPLACCLAACALAGCANPDNNRLTLSGAAERPWNAEPISAPSRGPALAQAAQPSITDGSRAHWPEVVTGTGGDAIEHHEPVAPLAPAYTDATARQRGEYPTVASAFEVGGDTGAQVAEGFAAPFHAAYDILAMLPRAIGGAGRAARSAGERFARTAMQPSVSQPEQEQPVTTSAQGAGATPTPASSSPAPARASAPAPAPTGWEVTPQQVRDMRARGDLLVIDCRTEKEHAVARIEGAVLIPLDQLPARLGELEKHADETIVVYCHHGVRSMKATTILRQAGFEKAVSMAGGLERWSIEIDPTVPRY